MIIDIHTHTFPPKIAASTLEKLSRASHTRPFTDGTGEGLAASMAQAGVDCSVVLPVATAARQVEHINDSAAAINSAWPDTGIRSFGCMHPEYENWHGELARVKALGLKGIKLHPVYQGVDLDDARYLRILERAGELGLIVITHAGLDVGFPGVVRCSPEMVRRALGQVGPVTLILAHMGGWRSWKQVLELLPDTTALIDTSFSVGRMCPLDDGYYKDDGDLDLLDGPGFLELVRAFGSDRVLFGSDSPWSSQKESREWIEAQALTGEERAAILGGNAQRLLEM